MNFIEICNNNLYEGLRALQDHPKYEYSIYCNGIIYTKYDISDKENSIYISNDLGDMCYMDLNDFVRYVNEKIIEINIIERKKAYECCRNLAKKL